MKILIFGSLNIDHVYQMDHFVQAGETVSALDYQKNEGGKGLNQAIALSKAGQKTYIAGAIGQDGLFLQDLLQSGGVNTRHLQIVSHPTGHAIIQVDRQGQNCIFICGGANQQISQQMMDDILAQFSAGDYILMQNEISNGDYLIRAAHARGMHVILNPSPLSPALMDWPLEFVEWFILNEIEGAALSGKDSPDDMLDALLSAYPKAHIVLTLGGDGAVYADDHQRLHQPAISVQAVDTTAAGDTFTGYFFHAILAGYSVSAALKEAAVAASIAVSRPGAGRSIPLYAEVKAQLANQQ